MGVIFIDFLLLTLMTLGICLIIFSNSILWVWFSMEVLSLSVVMFILSKDSSEGINLGNVKSMSLFKYMLLQFIGGVSLLGVLMMSGGLGFVLPFLLLKLGLVPFHSWVLDVYGSLSLIESYLLGVVPKLSPLILLEYTSESSLLIYTGLISVSMGGWLSMMYTDLRQMLACSSIMSSSWMLLSLSVSMSMMLLFFVTYSLGSLVLMMVLEEYKTYWVNSSSSLKGRISVKVFLGILSLSTMGLPLFYMFFLKLLVVGILSELAALSVALIFSSVSVVFYGRISLGLWSYESLVTSMSSDSWKFSWSLSVVLSFLFGAIFSPSLIILWV